MHPEERQFDVALSFAGEDRAYVERVANALRQMGIRVFYDKYETVSLWGKNLYDHLQEVYQTNARYAVIFISKHYAEKLWTNHERKSAQARAFSSNQEYILPARFDDTEVAGILPTTGFVNLNEYTPEEFAELIKRKIGPLLRYEFLPEELDVIYEMVAAEAPCEQEEVDILVTEFFGVLKLMTPEERSLLITAIANTCPNGPPDNVHLNIEVLSRLSSIPAERIIATFARLDCLGITSRVYTVENPEDDLCKGKNILEIEFTPLLADVDVENATYVAIAIVEGVTTRLCPDCSRAAFERLDFSILNKRMGYPD